MIPDEAVEAAWEAFSMGRDGMRIALEAAAPFMLASQEIALNSYRLGEQGSIDD